MREGGDAVEVWRAGEFERVGDAAMEQRPRGGTDVVVGRLADERVGEPEGAGGARHLVNDARSDRRVELREHRVRAEFDGRRESGDVELAADHGGRGEHASLLGREWLEP